MHICQKCGIKERKLTTFCRESRIARVRKTGKEWMIPSGAVKPIDKRTKEFENLKLEIEEVNSSIHYSVSNREDKVVNSFGKKIW